MKRIRVIILLFFVCSGANAQDLYSPENSKRFALHLFNSGQYEFAAREYERITYMVPDDDSIKWMIVKSYSKAGMNEKVLQRAPQLYQNQNTIPPKIAFEYSKSFIFHGGNNPFSDLKDKNMRMTAIDSIFIQSASMLLSQQWSQAKTMLGENSNPPIPYSSDLNILADEGLAFRYKKPGLALALSAIVPGSGKIYTKDWKDGLLSFIAIGGLGFQCYRSFVLKGVDKPRGWIYGGFALTFYSANLYGSHKAAKKYNQRFNDYASQKVLNILQSAD